MNSGSSSGCSTSSPSKWLPTPASRRVLRSTSKMQRRPRPASAKLRRNQLLPVPAPPRTAITRRCWRGRRLKGLILGFVVLLITQFSSKSRFRPETVGGGASLAPTGGEPDRKVGSLSANRGHSITGETAAQQFFTHETPAPKRKARAGLIFRGIFPRSGCPLLLRRLVVVGDRKSV